jgi:histidine triad (HIT) family protein
MIASNAPQGYICPICLGVQGTENEHTVMRQTDVVYRDDLVTVFINSFFSGHNNDGFAIVVPNEHFENLYTLPAKYGHRVFEVAQKVALAMKQAYQCDGITTRQNNEPAGDQHAFHFHFHIWPRYADDGYNTLEPKDKWLADPAVRAKYAQKLAAALKA